MTDDAVARALAAIDAAHAADPAAPDGVAAELRYAERLAGWVERLAPDPDPALRLAARAQHLERWTVARGDFPEGRAGYHAWRKAVQRRQGERVRALLGGAAVPAEVTERVAALVAKTAPRDPAAQVLEDAACLVFLEHELAGFAVAHPDYERAKLVDILRKTWGKMSARARDQARALPLAPALRALVVEAAAPGAS